LKRRHSRHGRVQRLKAKLYRRIIRRSIRALNEWVTEHPKEVAEVLTLEKMEKAIADASPKVGTLWFNSLTRETLRWDGGQWVPWPPTRFVVRPDGTVVVTESGTLPGCEITSELVEPSA
jgi:hypothetical protein